MWTILEKSFRQIGTLLWLVINRFMWKNRQSEPESEVPHGFHSRKHYLFRFLCFCRKRMNILWQRSQLHQLERNIEGSIRIRKTLYPCFESHNVLPLLNHWHSFPPARFHPCCKVYCDFACEGTFIYFCIPPQKKLMWEMIWSLVEKNISVRKWL